LFALVILAAVLGASLGYFLRFDLPDVRKLADYNPPVMSSVLDTHGAEVATFAEQRRILIALHDIPMHFRQALVATEDRSFYRHPGVDLRSALRALWADVRARRIAEGASTLTMQLAGNLFLDRSQRTVRRKVQEVLLALEIERQYTKPEILAYYCNQIYMGHGRDGLEAASRHYFGKPARGLSLPESATLAGLIQRPEALSPFKNPERSLARRNSVLRRMLAEEMITPEQAEQAMALPIETAEGTHTENPAPYFVEEVRRWLQERYGSTSLYKAGFEVRTTIDPRVQRIANVAVDSGLRQLDKRQGWRGIDRRVPEDSSVEVWEPSSWNREFEVGQVTDGVVLAVDDAQATVRVGAYRGTLGPDEIRWTRKKTPDRLLSAGDVIRVRIESIDEEEPIRIALEQEPQVEAALVAIDPRSGAIKALVGGFDFERSEFDRAIQAKRQTGSAFKPIVYAAALNEGFSLADLILDQPTVFLDRRNPVPYQPENYSNKYYETITLRTSLEKSANIATVKLLDRIGYDAVIGTAERLGIGGDLQPFPSLALGSFEISLLRITAAYGAFANQGVLVEPFLVEEVHSHEGALLERLEPAVRDAVSPEIAFLMNRVLSGVITDGTGRAASSLGLNLAGKTGTTDQNTDAWFIGYAPELAVGVWVGFDEPKTLGSRETGAQAALPIWRAFMEGVFAGETNADFEIPSTISFVSIDRETGLKANLGAACRNVITEVFVRGTEPTEYCTRNHHQRLGLPYPFQRFELNDQGALVVDATELERLLSEEVDVFLIDGGSAIEAHTTEGTYALPLEIVKRNPREPLPSWLAERFDIDQWVGLDGREAEVVWMR